MSVVIHSPNKKENFYGDLVFLKHILYKQIKWSSIQLYIIHKFYFVGRQEIWKTKKKKPSPSSYLMVILLQLPLILIWKNLILDPLLPPPLLLFQQHQIPTFFRIIQLLQNVQRYLKVTPLLTRLIKNSYTSTRF